MSVAECGVILDEIGLCDAIHRPAVIASEAKQSIAPTVIASEAKQSMGATGKKAWIASSLRSSQ
jgi:hypothetical protein